MFVSCDFILLLFNIYTYVQKVLGHFDKRTMALIWIMRFNEKLFSYAASFIKELYA